MRLINGNFIDFGAHRWLISKNFNVPKNLPTIQSPNENMKKLIFFRKAYENVQNIYVCQSTCCASFRVIHWPTTDRLKSFSALFSACLII